MDDGIVIHQKGDTWQRFYQCRFQNPGVRRQAKLRGASRQMMIFRFNAGFLPLPPPTPGFYKVLSKLAISLWGLPNPGVGQG